MLGIVGVGTDGGTAAGAVPVQEVRAVEAELVHGSKEVEELVAEE